MQIVVGLLRILGAVLFMYLGWKNLRENYSNNKIVEFFWLAWLAFLVAGRLTYGCLHWGVWNDSWWNWVAVWSFPGMDYLGGYLGVVGLTYWYGVKNEWKIWVVYEDITLGLLVWMAISLFGEWLGSNYDKYAGLGIIMAISTLILMLMVKSRYRSLVWYKSGKKGFLFLAANIVFSCLLSMTSLILGNKLMGLGMVIWCLTSVALLLILGETVVIPSKVSNSRRSK